MSVPKTYKTEAIILRHVDLGEADRILTLYTPNRGKLRAVARGVRKTKSKLGGHVEPITHCSLMLSSGRNLEIVNQSQVIDNFLTIHNDLQLAVQAMYLIELTDAFTSEYIENYPVYRLLLDALHHLSMAHHAELLFRYFELQLMGHLGYRPQLYECLNCKAALEPRENFFSPSGGGIVCASCVHTELAVYPVSANTLKLMRLLQRGDYATAGKLRIPSNLSRELERAMKSYIRYLLERELKCAEFLDRLEKEGIAPAPN